MFFTSAQFCEFETFKEAAAFWDLDFNLLSKNDFNANLSILSSENVQIGRLKLNGKIDQHGLCPVGFQSFVIPIDFGGNYIWRHRKIEGNPLIIFPKDGILDSVSCDGFDVYVVSIEEQYLYSLMEDRGYKGLLHMLSSGNELKVQLQSDFQEDFHKKASSLFSQQHFAPPSRQPREEEIIYDIVDSLLFYLERSNAVINAPIDRKRDLALRKATEFVFDHLQDHISLSELCKEGAVSERTLEYAFKETYQVSPIEYIKSIKLNKVRSELHNSEGQMIFTIAAKYGFWHMGQFAADFKKQFGVLPSDFRNNS